jgi:Protein of unknown function (DUF4031)
MKKEIKEELQIRNNFYIDSPRIYSHKSMRVKYSHLVCFSSIEDLHDFAFNLIDLKRCWFHSKPYPHYDVSERKYALALESGAVLISTREMIQRFKVSKFSKKLETSITANLERHVK